MTTVTGEMAVLLGVLGYRQGDSRILEAIALVGPGLQVEEFDFDGEKSTYFTFKPAGTDLLFENDVLVSAMVRTQQDSQDGTYGLYPRPDALVDGLSPTASRAEVGALLGPPERSGPNFDRFRVNNHYLHVEFGADNRIARLSALLEPV
ncbi:hypothetical protein [Amycolatopsis sp. 195334CR]|uniref:hypothetical protein n=1 Tax=Amycolatopsis sp. 195334CR TaxID=2814588 RepID=UPI001A8C7BC7|nr:hypothetical protein [Amycolatopsis sp. 195334CR]MBN6037785.1 hypothetical protein [Amycolatopsis sp. 195334CR]